MTFVKRWWPFDSLKEQDPFPLFLLALALLLGAFVRLAPALSVDFPLNDGGLFYAMVQDIQAARYALPLHTTYNAAAIPFAYQPLAFYLAALLSDLTGWALLDLFRVLPAIVSVLTIYPFFLLARAMLRSMLQAALATLAFALLPWSFLQLIKGGGLTRSIGFLWALLALYQIYQLYTQGRSRFVLGSILLSSLTVYTHPDMTLFVVYSAVLFFLFYGRNRRAFFQSLWVTGGVLVLTAPWWLTVILRYGPSPLLSAIRAGSHGWGGRLLSLIAFNFTGEPFSSLLGILGLLGLFVMLARERYLLPLWLLALFFPRGEGAHVMVPLAMLVGLGLDQVVLPAVSRPPAQDQVDAKYDGATSSSPLGGLVPTLVLVFFIMHGLLSAWGVTRPALAFVHVLPQEDREAMAWVAANTAEDSTFVLVTAEAWWKDPVSEWFPALARRVSLATPQGNEWLPQDQFLQRVEQYDALQACAGQEVACLEKWAAEAGAPFSHVYVSKHCCLNLGHSLQNASDYILIYDGPGVMVFARSILP